MMTKVYLIAGILVGAILTYLIISLFLNTDQGSFPNIFPTETKMYDIPDECGLLMGTLFNTIKSESDCRIKCRAKCSTFNKKYDKVVFDKKENTCNSCKCYCK